MTFYLKIISLSFILLSLISGCESSLEDEKEAANNIKIEQYLDLARVKYIKTNGIYTFIQHKGYGYEVAPGDSIAFWYAGYTLSKQLFDTNVRSIAEEAGLSLSSRSFDPVELVAGNDYLIEGLSKGLLLCRLNQTNTILFPSSLGYGGNTIGEIKPWSPIAFDIFIIYVKNEKIIREQININNFVAGLSGFAKDTIGLWSKLSLAAVDATKPAVGDTIYAWYQTSTLEMEVIEETQGNNQQIVLNDNITEGLQLGFMRLNLGEAMQLVVPSPLGYGNKGNGRVDPYTPLFYKIRLDSIK